MAYEIQDISALVQHAALNGENHLIGPPENPINDMIATTSWVINKIQSAQLGGTSTVDGGSF